MSTTKTLDTKTLDIKTEDDARSRISDFTTTGNSDRWQLLSKASSQAQGWMVSTKAYEIPGAGCLVNVTRQQGDHVADALQWVPGVRVAPDDNDGRQLVPLASE